MNTVRNNQNKDGKAKFISPIFALFLLILMVMVPIPTEEQAYAQAELEQAEEKEPTLEDIYQLLKQIQKKLEEKKVEEITDYSSIIKITDWSLYVAWGVPTIHNVTIENISDTSYKDIKIKALYYYSYSTDYGRERTGEAEGILPVTLFPHSKETYFKDGFTLERSSAASMYGGAKEIEVIGTTPIEEDTLSPTEKDFLSSIQKDLPKLVK